MLFFKYLFSTVNYIITLFISLLLAFTYFGAHISPASTWWLSLLTLAAPVIVIATILVFLYNAAKLKWIALIPFIVLLFGIGKIDGQFNLLFFKDYNNSKGNIKILSHNVRVFADDKWGNALDSTINFVMEEKPNIVAFQEFYTSNKFDLTTVDNLMKGYRYSTVDYFHKDAKKGIGLAIFSKYEIVNKGSKIFYGDYCGMQWADLAINRDTVRVFNIHLNSNMITREETKMLSQGLKDINPLFKDSAAGDTKIANMIKRFKSNVIERSFHSDTLAQIIASSPFASVVCGDINDVPFSYCYNTIKGDLNDSYSLKGDLYGYSYNRLHKFLKIDYIFTPENYVVHNYKSHHVSYSDHNPIIIEISK